MPACAHPSRGRYRSGCSRGPINLAGGMCANSAVPFSMCSGTSRKWHCGRRAFASPSSRTRSFNVPGRGLINRGRERARRNVRYPAYCRLKPDIASSSKSAATTGHAGEPIRESCRTGRHTPAQPRPRPGLRTSPPWPTLLAGHPSPIRPRTVTLWLHPQRSLQLSLKFGFLVFGGLTNNVNSGTTLRKARAAMRSRHPTRNRSVPTTPPCDGRNGAC